MMPDDWRAVRYFKVREFDSPDAPGSGMGMDFDFIFKLDSLRHRWGKPVRVNSGFRTPAHNLSVGGKSNSAHLRGKAADCKMSGLEDCIRFSILAAFMGFRRVGIDKKGSYVHVDSDDALPMGVVWFYGDAFA